MNNSFLDQNELNKIGLKSYGKDVYISRLCRFYNPELIEIGDHVRIDDFSILSGTIKIGNFVHISAFSALYGKYGIELEDFSGISPRCTIFSATDDFSGDYLIGPMINHEFRNVTGGKVHIKKYSQLGSNCVILPKITINVGVAVGAMSLITCDLEAWGIYAGIPAKFLKERKTGLIDLENKMTCSNEDIKSNS